jgi:hypothetical protein
MLDPSELPLAVVRDLLAIDARLSQTADLNSSVKGADRDVIQSELSRDDAVHKLL